MVETDGMALPHLCADPGDIVVDLRLAAPGVPVERLALRRRDDPGPVAQVDVGRRRVAGCGDEAGGKNGGQPGTRSHVPLLTNLVR
jgi:hypothetical protein